MLRSTAIVTTVWRSALVAASAGMLAGGVLHAAGLQQLSATLVTAAFALAMLAVLVGLADRPEPTEEQS